MTTEQLDAGPERTGLAESLRTVRRRWVLVVTMLLLTAGSALGLSLATTPVYLASADVLIEPSGADIAAGTGTKISADEVATQTQVVTSLPVARLVQQHADLPEVPDLTELVSVQPIGTSRILRISAQDTDPQQAADTANTLAAAYLQFREAESVGRFEEASRRLAADKADLEQQLEDVDKAIEKNPGQADLQSERRTILTSLAQVATQLDALAEQMVGAAGGGKLMREATADMEPVAPQTELNVILGALLGLALGIGAALLRARFDDGVHAEEDVQQALNAVVLGRVPQWSDRNARDRLVTLIDPHSPPSEEYQRLGVNVRFMVSTDTESGAVVLLTSATEGEGKTVTACNLAVSMARLGQRVVLVDADFRRAMVASRFGLGDPPGLSDLLADNGVTETYLIDVGIDRLSLLPAGTLPPNPAALLSSARLNRVLADLTTGADVVIVDSPPLLTGADPLELARHADMVLIVARERVSHTRKLHAVRDALQQIDVARIGAVFNSSSDLDRGSATYARRERTVRHQDGDASGTARPAEKERGEGEAPVSDVEDHHPEDDPDLGGDVSTASEPHGAEQDGLPAASPRPVAVGRQPRPPKLNVKKQRGRRG